MLADLTRELVPPRRRPDEESLSAVLCGRADRDTEIGTDEVALILRSIPLRPHGERIGALVLLRDVTDLRRRDRELVTKDATIREIHHRVKNNLQTVAALLRLQARRIEQPEARAALEEAVRRVGSIAIVHETLSQAVEETVDFDEIADRLGRMVTDVSAVGAAVRVVRRGSFGVLASETATALAMVLTEVLQNAVEHGYPRPGLGDARGPVEIRMAVTAPSAGSSRRLRRRRGAARAASTSPRRPAWVSRSCGPSSSPSSAGSSRWGRRPGAAEPGCGSTSPGLSGPSGGADAGAGVAALERATLVLAEATPDAVVLTSLERPREALFAHLAATAHLLGLLDLEDGRTGVADREEQLRVLVEAGRAAAPIHGRGFLFLHLQAVCGRSAEPGRSGVPPVGTTK